MQRRDQRYLMRSQSIWPLLVCASLFGFSASALAESDGTVQQMANALMHQQSTSASVQWDREEGLRVEAMQNAWYNTANEEYFRYVKNEIDASLSQATNTADSDTSRDTSADDLLGRGLLLVYRVTLDARYFHAAEAMRQRLAPLCLASSEAELGTPQPEHAVSPQCTAESFLTEYAAVFHTPEDFPAIAHALAGEQQASVREGHTPSQREDLSEDAKVAVSLVETLPNFPLHDPGRDPLIAQLRHFAIAAEQNQNPATGVLYESQVQNTAERIRLSDSTASLIVFTLMKGVRLGYLPAHYAHCAEAAWHSIQASGARMDENIEGELLLAANEMALAPHNTAAAGSSVLLDAWYNSQQRKNAAGMTEYYHYKWSDLSDSGFSLFGHMWRSVGATTDTLYEAPTPDALRSASFYLIVSPDIPQKNPNPHYMTNEDAAVIENWVRQGGVLILMENDPPNSDLAHLNLLADRFGIHFDDVLLHHTVGDEIDNGRIPIAADGPVFRRPHTIYLKDTCAISVHDKATALLSDRGAIVMAAAHLGKGTVFAMVDPWLYNEYTDGRKNPLIYSQFDNFAAGEELVQWLLQQQPHEAQQRKTLP